MLLILVVAAFLLELVEISGYKSTTFQQLKQDGKFWPLAGTGRDVVKVRGLVDCGSICHSLRPACNSFNWFPGNLTCEMVNTVNAFLEDAPGAMAYVNASSVCYTSPPALENRTMYFSYGWNGSLPAPLLSEVSYDCPIFSRCPPLVPLKAKCIGPNTWQLLNVNVTPSCLANTQGYELSTEDGRMYKRYPGPMNRTEASRVCCQDGAILASDTSGITYSSIRIVAMDTTEAILQGATDEAEEGTWIYEDTSFLQVNNTPITSYNWWGTNSSLPAGQQQAPNGGRDKNCLSLLGEYWFDIPCSTELPFVCQYF
ncbi:unnamed protein product [Darwinula stevensoni]|uniref:C-type lectin domain-containing protein n=1 Tax=Darwinula stevensoni TaxID=69355 RepID=A0A7R8XDB9_9CRUS|nr:unnamed protein product [Darwinula stevensoni]CAG0893353.1 unnamed protein product [Darwinula stevensoni]